MARGTLRVTEIHPQPGGRSTCPAEAGAGVGAGIVGVRSVWGLGQTVHLSVEYKQTEKRTVKDKPGKLWPNSQSSLHAS